MTPTETCIVPDCNKITHARGLCRNHYSITHGYVSRGTYTWEDLEARGKVRKKKPPGRHSGEKFQKWLSDPEMADPKEKT